MTNTSTNATITSPGHVSFFVAGRPIAQGSMKAIGNRANGTVKLTSSSGPKLQHWRDAIGWEARQHIHHISSGPVWVTLTFRLTKPKSVAKTRERPTVKPDIDKLARAALDALAGIAYADDSQVVSLRVSKRYGLPDEQPGVLVEVQT